MFSESESESEFDAAVAADLGTTRQEGRRARRGQSALAAGDSGDECIFDTADASPTAPSGTRKRLAAKRRRVVESESESEDESEAEDDEGLMDLSAEEEFVSVDDAALRWAAPHVEALAMAEGLDAHAESVRLRLADLDGSVTQ